MKSQFHPDDAGAKEFYEESGFDGFLSKPVSPKKLEHTLFSKLDKRLIQESTAEEEEDIETFGIDAYTLKEIEQQKKIFELEKKLEAAKKKKADLEEIAKRFQSM